MPRLQKPSHFEQLTGPDAYEKLRFYASRFAKGDYNCLIVLGPPGRLKSSIFAQEVQGRARIISCHATPFDVFCQAQEHTDRLLILDDADSLYADAQGQRLLKLLTNPRKPVVVEWNSAAPERVGLKKSFTTSSRVCLIDNAWGGGSEHVAALEDRSRLFLFDPPPVAVHQEVKQQGWFRDDEVYAFVGRLLPWVSGDKGLSVRVYVKALEAKRAGEDWKRFVLGQFVSNPADVALLAIEEDPTLKDQPVEARCRAWMGRTGLSRSAYFDRKRLLRLHQHRAG
jgi:hypothetical protein